MSVLLRRPFPAAGQSGVSTDLLAGPLTAQAIGTAPVDVYGAAVWADTPVSYYRLDESSGSPVDSVTGAVGSHNAGVLVGQAGKITTGLAASYDGLNDYSLVSAPGLGTNLLTATFECWLKTTTGVRSAIAGTLRTGTSSIFGVYLNTVNDVQTAGKTEFHLRDAAGVTLRGNIGEAIYDGAWHHLVFQAASSTTINAWVDGQPATVTHTIAGPIASFAEFDFATALGARDNRGTAELFAAVTLDEVAFYTTRLSQARVQAHYAAAQPLTTSAQLRQPRRFLVPSSGTTIGQGRIGLGTIGVRGSVGQQAALGLPVATGAALAIQRSKVRAIGVPAVATAALPATRRKTRVLGLAVEADASLAVGRAKARTVGPAAESDAALAVTRRKQRATGLATEALAALTVARLRSRVIGAAADVTAALPAARSKQRALGVAGELESALTALRVRSKALGTAAETGAALGFARAKRGQIGVAAEAEAALPDGRRKQRAVGLVGETAAALTFGRLRSRAFGIAVGVLQALGLGRSKRATVGVAAETDTALPVGFTGHRFILLGVAAETDTGLAVTARKRRAVGLPLEAMAALAATRVRGRALGTAAETAATLAEARRKTRALATSVETDAALLVGRGGLRTVALGIAAEASQALGFARRRSRALGVPTALNAALAFRARKARALDVATESDAALNTAQLIFVPFGLKEIGGSTRQELDAAAGGSGHVDLDGNTAAGGEAGGGVLLLVD